jgi:hypothetical protein
MIVNGYRELCDGNNRIIFDQIENYMQQ